jgi:hypothetical protein
MTNMRALPFVIVVATMAACSELPPSAATTEAIETHRTVSNACDIFTEGCTPVTGTIDIVEVDMGDRYVASTDGTRYYVSDATRFFPTDPLFPTDPTIPNDPVFPNDPIVPAWNTLVESRASYKAFLALLRTLPPNPILPPSPIRFQVETLYDGTDYFVTSLQPVLVATEGF